MSNDLILEVEESLKEERIAELWKEYGGYLIAACILAILFTALIVGYRGYNETVSATQTALIVEALRTEEITPKLDAVVDDLNGGRKAIAMLSAAGAYVQDSDYERALTYYQALRSDGSLPDIFRDFALLLEVKILWNGPVESKTAAAETTVDEAQTADAETQTGTETLAAQIAPTAIETPDPAVLIEYLAPLRNDERNPWRYNALILSSVILADGLQDHKAAVEYLRVVEDAFNVPQTLRTQAQALIQVYSLSITDDQDATQAEPAKQAS